uniref:Alpha-protein kinase 1-like n=1 Tax=Dermatophagoides pteronyssinus TaxID=6956 RepID=A0A6P6XLI9_DERPT|nr:alpha-protein kinase 1-like [Dermatophagoides pteronyssinus]
MKRKMKLTLAFILAIFVANSSALLFRSRTTNPSKVVVQSPAVKTVRHGFRNFPIVQQQIQQMPESDRVEQIPMIDNVYRQPIRSYNEPLNIPVFSSHNLQVIPVNVETPMQQSQVIAIEPSTQAIHLVFKSVSNPLSIHQQHSPGERSFYETTRSEEPAHIIRHEVYKPVVQELQETIQPYRQVTQEIRPVIEKVNVIVPKAEQVNRKYVDHVQRDFIVPMLPGLPKFPKLPSIIFPRPVVQQPEQQQQQRFPVQQQQQQEVREQQQQQQQQVSNLQSSPERYTVPIIIEHPQQQRIEDTNEENFD